MASALDTLKKLAQKKTVEETTPSPLVVQMQDPALAGAKREKNVVRLGFDPSIANRAAEAAGLKEALDEATARFAIVQAEMRQYGVAKRGLYNDTFKADVTTVCVPYIPAEDPTGTAYISVTCTNRYTVHQDVALGLRPVLGPKFDKLFKVSTTKELKSNAEELIRNLLAEMGLKDEELIGAMDALFDTKKSVAAVPDYEKQVKEMDEETKTLLSQCVKRVEAGLKFG